MSLTPVLHGDRRAYPAPGGLPGLLRRAAATYADRVACDDGRQLTYRDLDLVSEMLAARLAGQPGAVALFLRRGNAIAVAVLACVKAGRAFVPLPVEQPWARLDTMVRIARPTTVLIDAGADLPHSLTGLDRIEVPRSAGARPDRAETRAPAVVPDPRAAAYVLFTSGSSGSPKGVQVPYQALVNRLLWAQETFRLTTADVVLQKTPYTFDVALWEILWPLLTGARTQYLSPGAHLESSAIIEAIQRHSVTLCHFVPALLEEFLRRPSAAGCVSLRDVLCSGEVLRPDVIRRFGATLPTRLHNLYGPTEAAIDVTHWPVPEPRTCTTSYIGRPVANTAIHVLDERLRPVPLGSVGELCVSGVQLADGYIGRPDLTAASFVVLPGGTRAYRTGDLARVSGGWVEYIGRSDSQVKIRGVRVEPGEVEAVLGEHPEVGDVAVVTRSGTGGYELVAYVTTVPTPAAGGNGSGAADRPDDQFARDLRTFVRAALPPQFVPSAVYRLPALPRTPSGKHDLQRLRADALDRQRPRQPWSPDLHSPADPLGAAWREATGTSRADETIGFLDAGGDSLGAARVVAAVLVHSRRRAPMSWLVVENISLAELRRRADTVAAAPEAVPSGSGPEPVDSPLPLSAAQRRLLFIEQLRGTLAPFNVVSALSIPGRVDAERLRQRLRELMHAHSALRAWVRTGDDGEPVQCIAPDADPPVSLREAAGDLPYQTQVDRLLEQLQREPLPSGRPPLFRVVLLTESAGGQTTVAFAGNHLICDQYSMELIWAQLLGEQQQQPLHRRPGAVNGGAPGEEHRAALEYWRESLAGVPTHLDLPFRTRDGAVPNPEGHTAVRRMEAMVLEAVREAADRAGVRMSALVLTAYAAALTSWTGADEVVVGVAMDARRTVEQAESVGLLIDTLPIRIATPAGAQLRGPAGRCGRAMVEAARQAVVPFDDIVTALQVPRPPGRNPLFQAWFNDLQAVERPLLVGGQPVDRPRVSSPPALFDVALYLHPVAGGGLRASLTCAPDFDPRVARHLLDAVFTVLERFVADNDVTVGASLPAGAQPPSRTAPRRTDPVMLLNRVLSVAASEPDRTAIVGTGGRLSYGELDGRVAALAAVLQQRGGGPASRVAVLARRTPDLAVAILAGWRAMVPIVLLDAQLPPAYLASAVARVGAAWGIRLSPGDRARLPVPTVDLDELIDAGPSDAGLTAVRADRPEADVTTSVPSGPAHTGVAHILATSGSSGLPKLVEVDGEAFATALTWYVERIGLHRDDRLAVLAASGHDPIFRDLVAPLLVGAHTVVPGPAETDPSALFHLLAEARVTLLHLTPVRAGLLADAAEAGAATLPDVRAVVLGGGASTGTLVKRVRRMCPAAVLFNGYGTTEVPQLAGLHPVPDGPTPGAAVPLGRGAAGRALVVLRDRTPAAPGQRGLIGVVEPLRLSTLIDDELPVLVPAAAKAEAWPPVVLTGDVGRVNLDGDVEWCGWADRHVSVDGHRVDVGEVAARLSVLAGVADAAAAVRTDEVGPALVAYLVPGPGLEVSREWLTHLTDQLRAVLPPAAVPVELIPVRHLGLDRNGKPDPAASVVLEVPPSAAGAEPDMVLVEAVRRHVPAGNPLDVTTNFFDAGLDSYAVLRLLHDLRRAGYRDLTLVDLFTWPNIAALAAALRRRSPRGPGWRQSTDMSRPGSMPERRRAIRRWLHGDRNDAGTPAAPKRRRGREDG